MSMNRSIQGQAQDFTNFCLISENIRDITAGLSLSIRKVFGNMQERFGG